MVTIMSPHQFAKIIYKHITFHKPIQKKSLLDCENSSYMNDLDKETLQIIASEILQDLNTELAPIISDSKNYRLLPLELREFLESDTKHMFALGILMCEATEANIKLNKIRILLNKFFSIHSCVEKQMLIESINLLIDGK